MSSGQRTLPGTIDELARNSGSQIWARYPVSSKSLEAGELRPITFAILANAINRLASYLDGLLLGHNDLETVCYIGPSDIRYFILACAACKCRLKALFSSPRNNLDAHLSLLENTECRILLGTYENTQDSTLQSLVTQGDLRFGIIPSLEELLQSGKVEPFPWDKAFTEVANEPFIILHTSGTTGLPKPVNISHGLIATIDGQQSLADVDGRSVTARHWANRSVYTALPPFHSAGINFFCFSIFQSTELVLGPSDTLPSLDVVEKMLDAYAADAAVLPPSLLSEVAADEGLLRKISQWSSVTFGGGPLPQEAGDALWQQTRVLQILGSTETFNVPELEPESVDEWEYHFYHPRLGIDFRLHSENLHELVFVRDAKAKHHQGAFWTFPDQHEYSMKDLYERHPSKSNHWRYRGRLDDIIVLSNGEKFNPTAAERIITRDKTVKSALIVGCSREQPALLIEPALIPTVDLEQRRASIVQVVELANNTLPGHAQIHESHIVVLDSPETFLRSSKGEVRRAPTVDVLGDVIAKVYEIADQSGMSSAGLNFSSEDSLTGSMARTISTSFFGGAHVADDDNIFERGLDSLKAMKLLRQIKADLRDQANAISSNLTPRAIYQHPTPRAMAKMIRQLSNGDSPDSENDESDLTEMQQMLTTFTSRLDSRLSRRTIPPNPSPKNRTIILTGSTGSLGSYLLSTLILTPTIPKIVCLNRQGGTAPRQSSINHPRGLTTDFSKVSFLEADLSRPLLGLSPEVHEALSRSTSHIIHNAWPVNFNSPLSSFAPQLEACINLIDLALTSSAKITFLSSVGAANNWCEVHDQASEVPDVPEKVLEDLRVAEPMGYARSKLLAELLFARAAGEGTGRDPGLGVNICRIGQIAGPVKDSGKGEGEERGMWNSREWFPSLVLGGERMGRLPVSLGAMDCLDWVPVDLLADIIVEVVAGDGRTASEDLSGGDGDVEIGGEGKKAGGARFLHFVNPRKAYWRDLVVEFVRHEGLEVEVVGFKEWVKGLEKEAEEENAAAKISAVKLIDFYRDIGRASARRPVFSTVEAQERSRGLRELNPVSLGWVRKWFRQWHNVKQGDSQPKKGDVVESE